MSSDFDQTYINQNPGFVKVFHIRCILYQPWFSFKGVKTGYQSRKLRIWKGQGVTVMVSNADIGTEEETRELISEAKRLGPVGGIFNLAMVGMSAML